MKKKKVLLLGLLAAISAGLAWALLLPRTDPQLAKVAELQTKVFDRQSNLPPEERREAFAELRREAEKLTPAQQAKLMRDNPPPFVRQMEKQMRDFFDLPADKRAAALDRAIDEMEKRRREMEKRFAENGGRPGGPGGGFGGGPGGGPGRGGPPGGLAGMDPQRRQDMAKRMLDGSTPESRAMRSEYMRQMQDRRQQRGLPPFPRPRF